SLLFYCVLYHYYLLSTSLIILAQCYPTHFIFNLPTTTAIYTLSLHDALPIFSISTTRGSRSSTPRRSFRTVRARTSRIPTVLVRSEEHTSELQSRGHLVCRLLLEKKKY